MIGESLPSPQERRWSWKQPVPLRWLLIDEYTRGQPDTAVAVCGDIDGLFVDPPPLPPVERYTLLGCVPAGRLRAAAEGTGGAWLGNVVLDAVPDPDRPPVGCHADTQEELLDVTVVGHRQSTLAPDRVDIDLEGRIREEPRSTPLWTLAQPPPNAVGYRITTDTNEPLGRCVDMAGLYRERPEPPTYPVTLLSCRPEPPLRAALEALRRGAGNPGGAVHRRRIAASIFSVTADGAAVPMPIGGLHGSVTGARRSPLGEGLLDVTFDSGVETMPAEARQIWKRWRTGPPRECGEWVGYNRQLRSQWALAALSHRQQGQPDRPAGSTYHLDGRYITDIEGFYCAIGEAVNGPAGYFGCNLDALHDCLSGGWGATLPCQLVWHDSAVARTHLVPGYDRVRWSPAITLDDVLRLLNPGMRVELR